MKNIRNNFTFKVITVYLALNMIFPLAGIQTGMYQAFALTGGPAQPEFNSFTPIGTSDMVDLASGDFNYNIPIMDVGGYPLNLAYNSGITMDQEASWVGLGWNLNVGQINRNVRGLPDDFDGDVMRYENDLKTNITAGANFSVRASTIGYDWLGLNAGIGIKYNNYNGFTMNPSFGVSFQMNESVSVGLSISGSTTEGATVSPNMNFNFKKEGETKKENGLHSSLGVGLSFNSRQAITSFNLSASVKGKENNDKAKKAKGDGDGGRGSFGGSYQMNDYMNFTPTKRVGMAHRNLSLSGSLGADITAFQLQFQAMAFGSFSKIKNSEKDKNVKAFGYEHTFGNNNNGILDFNREKDAPVSKLTRMLPITNYTYDTYSINGQGIGGSFRPYNSQVGFVNDLFVSDDGMGIMGGAEFGIGWNVHLGFDVKMNPSYSATSVWSNKNFALSKFSKIETPTLNYENSYYRMMGEINVDKNYNSIFINKLGGFDPIKIGLGGGSFNRTAKNIYRIQKINSNGIPYYDNISINSKIVRTKRVLRNQVIQKITKKEAINYNLDNNFIKLSAPAKGHHTAGIKILKNDGSTYFYGEAVYNTKKVETSFDVSTDTQTGDDLKNGTITYSSSNGGDHANRSDRYYNRITTPAYAYTYLLTSILSSDYQDINADGPSDDDLGTYTKFVYDTPYDYSWRVPYIANKAMFNEGLKSNFHDQKGSYQYGVKKMTYINTIETKTHIAKFTLSERKDGFGVNDENGGYSSNDSAPSKKIDKIELFSKSDLNTPIKVAHFVYNYSLCPDIDNNSDASPTYPELSNTGGKLTLKKVFFTYGNSKMGKYTPYTFNYSSHNEPYAPKDYDIWGYYKENLSANSGVNAGDTTTLEFPFVEQNQDKANADINANMWELTSIELPSGGKIDLELESDDYQFVQDRRASQMFKVSGVGNSNVSFNSNNNLFNVNGTSITHYKYLYVDLGDNGVNYINNTLKFIEDYIGQYENKEIYFRFLLNMVKDSSTKYDFVSGYFDIDDINDINVFSHNGAYYAAIPMQFLDDEGGWVTGNDQVNPISKAGWFFGRTYLNRIVYSDDGNDAADTLPGILNEMVSSFRALGSIFKNPNQVLEKKRCAQQFKPNKSWIRLQNPDKKKLGGGVRVKKLEMFDKWDEMTNHTDDGLSDTYKQNYGQEYNYDLELNDDGSSAGSSGVATFEPNGSKENPFVEPFENAENVNSGFFRKAKNRADRLIAPKESNFVEKPIGESFYPAAKVTYSRVTVKNLSRIKDDNQGNTIRVKKHATGKVVNEFYTTKDYPTISRYTDIMPEDTNGDGKTSPFFDKPSSLGKFLNIYVRNHITLSQGFVVHTNDMDGKTKMQSVYGEGQKSFISSVEYLYATKGGKLNNKLKVIDETGNVSEKIMGEHYDVVNDFRESFSTSATLGVNVNFAGFVVPFLFIGLPSAIPDIAYHEQKLNTATTTKVIHTNGILVKKIAMDLGSKVSTENLAWDANTGQVIVTKTSNEYYNDEILNNDNNVYYSLNYPAYWKYKQMGFATHNIDMAGDLLKGNDEFFNLKDKPAGINIDTFFSLGDELQVSLTTANLVTHPGFIPIPHYHYSTIRTKLWIAGFNDSKNGLLLMDSNGKLVNETDDDLKSEFTVTSDNPIINFKIVKSGYRNLQSASMASITMKKNPIETGNLINYSALNDIINASAIEYSDLWSPQCECLGLPNFSYIYFDDNLNGREDIEEVTNDKAIDFASVGFNPYKYNVKGNFKAIRSYAYLTNRSTTTNPSPREDGSFTNFNPFYYFDSTEKKWKINRSNWTFASQVSKYSPYGVELENKDALNRYSSAQYGFNYTLPTAVSSNSKYTEMGFDSFEDYNSIDCNNTHFGFKKAVANTIQNASIDDQNSHTGRKSIKVNSGTRAVLEKRIEDCSNN